MSHLSIGIDLGTTHTALAVARTIDGERPQSVAVNIPQLVGRGALEARPLLPSVLYFAHAGEGALALPWDQGRTHAVGEWARRCAAESPGRVIASAKSWLSYAGVDRRSNLLPLSAPPELERISPVEASFRILDHLAEAWSRCELPESGTPLAEQEIVIAVPASFDAAARELTVEAALAGGLENVTLLEEPQAALYAWLEAMGRDFGKHLQVGDVVLVVDVGGGTTDFSAIAVGETDGSLELHRVAVGEHILLGGDNMDLTLAHGLKAKLEANGASIDRWQLQSLGFAARDAKEQLFSRSELERVPVVIAGKGSQLLGSSLRSELLRSELTSWLVDGFFPEVPAQARPAVRQRVGLTQVGLPYASDPAITRHLAAFLGRQADALRRVPGFGEVSQGQLLRPTAVLFNGGVLKAQEFRQRLLSTLNSWLAADGAPAVRVLPGEDLELAVARGAAYFGEVRRGRGLRIRGGTARSYYVGIESPAPAVPGMEPPITALCLAPFGMEEGSQAALPEQVLGVVVGEPVTFRFFGSTVRREDLPGRELESWTEQELDELAPIEVTLPTAGRALGEVVPVRLRAAVTGVGTLELSAIPVQPLVANERWQVELNVRSDSEVQAP